MMQRRPGLGSRPAQKRRRHLSQKQYLGSAISRVHTTQERLQNAQIHLKGSRSDLCMLLFDSKNVILCAYV